MKACHTFSPGRDVTRSMPDPTPEFRPIFILSLPDLSGRWPRGGAGREAVGAHGAAGGHGDGVEGQVQLGVEIEGHLLGALGFEWTECGRPASGDELRHPTDDPRKRHDDIGAKLFQALQDLRRSAPALHAGLAVDAERAEYPLWQIPVSRIVRSQDADLDQSVRGAQAEVSQRAQPERRAQALFEPGATAGERFSRGAARGVDRQVVRVGLAGTGPVIASGLVARWFSKRRGTATESGTAREACSALVTSPGNSSGLLRRATPPY